MKLRFSRILVYLALQFVVASLYYLGSRLPLFEYRSLPLTQVDLWIKPHFLSVWIYISFFSLTFFAVYLTAKDDLILFLKLIFLNSIFSLAFFILYPTHIIDFDFSVLKANSPVSYELLAFVKKNDTNTNCFPSMHIANSLFASLFLFQLKQNFLKVISVVWFVLIVWSVMSTGQHYFYDVIGGVLLSGWSYLWLHRKPVINRFQSLIKLF